MPWYLRAAAALLACLPLAAAAQRSYFEPVVPRAGELDPGEINGLAQDRDGFLWLGARVGLIRFDGRDFVRWSATAIDQPVIEVYPTPGGHVIARARDGSAWITTPQGVAAVDGPGAAPLRNLRNLAFDPAGRLWCVLADAGGERLWRRDAHGWHEVSSALLDGESASRVTTLDDGVAIITDRSAWVARGDRPAQRLLREAGLFGVAGGGDRPYAVVSQTRALLWFQQPDGSWREAERPAERVIDLRYRGSTLWLSLDAALIAYEADGRVRLHDPQHGLPAGGTLLEDREHSLWLGSLVGLIHFPEPDTWNFTDADGLPGAQAFHVEAQRDQVWISTYRGAARLPLRGTRAEPLRESDVHGQPCSDARQREWFAADTGFRVWDDGQFSAVASGVAPRWLIDCTLDREGTLWLATAAGAYRLDRDADQPRHLAVAEFPDGVEVIWRDDGGDLWMALGDRACRYGVAGITPRLRVCAALPFPDHVHAVGVAAGKYWIGSALGLIAFDGRDAHRIAGERSFGGGLHHVATASRAGGYWAIGYSGALARIVACATCADDWRTVETIEAWAGVPSGSAKWAAEDAAGNLWIAGNRGVFRVPPAARAAPAGAPTVVPVGARVDGSEAPLGQALQLAPGVHAIDLGFAATSLRDRGRLRFRSRLGADAAWSTPTTDPALHFVALPPGAYRVEMQASLDGRTWSATPAQVEFAIAPPWYRTPWAYAAAVLALVAVLGLAYRLRVASLLRVERERTRIAMDLHDDLGAGIGAIGMLAGVAARSGSDAATVRRAAAEIAEAASLLGGGLRSLVWSMKSGRAGLGDLATQLVDHARRLLPGDEPRLVVRLPETYPAASLRADVRRQVLLIALEALHNAARHAQAATVTLELVLDGDAAVLAIADDGCGFDTAEPAPGSGLESMRRRAGWIGAQLVLEAAPGRGTRLSLRFRPFAPRRMIMSWRRGRIARRLPR